MESKPLEYSTTTIICATCGMEFETTVAHLFGRQFTIGKYCHDCAERLQEIEQYQEDCKLEAEKMSIRRRLRENCGIDPRYQVKDFTNFDTNRPGNVEKIFHKCVDYAENYPIDYQAWLKKTKKAYPSLVLFSTGVWGNGKTHLVSSIAHRILNRWNGENVTNPVRLISEPELYERIQQTYSYSYAEREQRESEQDIMNQLCRAHLLIIDDLGKTPRRDMDFVRRTMFNIINRRYKALLPVVITTNKDLEGLRDYLGNSSDEATLDRIMEMAEGKFLQVTGTSYRRGQ